MEETTGMLTLLPMGPPITGTDILPIRRFPLYLSPTKADNKRTAEPGVGRPLVSTISMYGSETLMRMYLHTLIKPERKSTYSTNGRTSGQNGRMRSQ